MRKRVVDVLGGAKMAVSATRVWIRLSVGVTTHTSVKLLLVGPVSALPSRAHRLLLLMLHRLPTIQEWRGLACGSLLEHDLEIVLVLRVDFSAGFRSRWGSSRGGRRLV